MAKKTNKTAHLLNTLTSGTTETEEAKDSQNLSAKEAAENKVIVVNETSENEKLANEIKSRLEAQLEADRASAAASGEVKPSAVQTDLAASADTAAESAAEAPAASAGSAGDPVPAAAAPQSAVTAPAGAVSEPAAKAAASAKTAAPAGAQEEAPRKRAYNMMNVMERMLANMEDEMESGMRRNGVCLCDRCRADVQALVLTNMPAKYVIVDSTNISPIMGYYENRYKITMLTEILKACTRVKEEPRH